MKNLTVVYNVALSTVILGISHALVREWMKKGMVFESYSSALSLAMRKTWAASKGEALIFSWEVKMAAPITTSDLQGLIVAKLATPHVIVKNLEGEGAFGRGIFEHFRAEFIRRGLGKQFFSTQYMLRSETPEGNWKMDYFKRVDMEGLAKAALRIEYRYTDKEGLCQSCTLFNV